MPIRVPRARRSGRALSAAVCLALATGLIATGCGSSGGSTAATTTTVTVPVTVPALTAGQMYYVSLGDSYAAGYQPTSAKSGATTRNGFAYQVVTDAGLAGHHFVLANFGCGGATTTSILHDAGCPALGPGGPTYPGQSQAAAAEAFITAHRGHIGLVTVSIGGNDVTHCAKVKDAISCVAAAVKSIDANLGTLTRGVRAAAGPNVPIVGITYPDVILGGYVSPSKAAQSLATLSVTAFKQFINPALKKQYEAVGGKFVDVTQATGAYLPLTAMATLAPYGRIPLAVARVCQLTYYCQFGDIHPRTAGYGVIARLVVAALPPHG